jgi:Zn-dependent peptidase ImmA (M78 family)
MSTTRCSAPDTTGIRREGKTEERRMPKTVELLVNPKVLEWARTSAGLSIPRVAQDLKVTEDYIFALENGDRKISLTFLERLVPLYKRSLTTFYLPQPPSEAKIPTDFRLLPNKQGIGPATAYALREARKLQEVLSDLAENPSNAGAFEPLSASLSDSPNYIGPRIREIVGVEIQAQMDWVDAPHAFRKWRGKLQGLGVSVFVADFPREEARGFSLWHPELTPAIVVCRNEAPAAQIFTLFHELAHILLRSDAMCLKREDSTFLGQTEAWCNRVAAATLVPAGELEGVIQCQGVSPTKDWTLNDLRRIASVFKVSRHVVAIRLEQLGHANSGYYNRIKDLLASDDYTRDTHRKQEGDQAKKFKRNIPKERLAEVGFATATAILEACKSSALSTIEAANLLRVSPSKFDKLDALASGQSQRYG